MLLLTLQIATYQQILVLAFWVVWGFVSPPFNLLSEFQWPQELRLRMLLSPSRVVHAWSMVRGSNVQTWERGKMSQCFLLLRFWCLIPYSWNWGAWVQQASLFARLEGKVPFPGNTIKIHIATINIMEDSKNTDWINIYACIINHFLYNMTSNEQIHMGFSLMPFLSEIPQISPSLKNIPAILSYSIL